MRKIVFLVLFVLFSLTLASLPHSPFSIPEAYAGTVTYTWLDSVSTVNITNIGSASIVAFATLRTQDRAAIKAHQLHPIDSVSSRYWETSPLPGGLDSEAEVRPLDDLALRLKVEVVNCTVAGVLTISGTNALDAAISENVNVAANTTYQTTNYFRTVTQLSDDGALTCKWKLWQDRWGIFGYNPGVPAITTDYVLQGGIIINNGVTFTQTATYAPRYKLTMRITLTDAAIDINPNTFITVNSGGTLILGKLENAAAKTVTNGVAITILSDLPDNEIINNGGTMCFYGSTVQSMGMRISSNIGSTSRLWGCSLLGTNIMGYGYDISNHSVIGGYVIECTSMPFTATSIDRVTALKPPYVIWDRWVRTADVTLSNVYSRGHSRVLADIASGSDSDVYLINPDFDTWTFTFAAGRLGEVYRQYEFDLATTANSTIEITYYGQGGGTIFNQTDADGIIPTQTISKGFYNQTGGNTIYSYEPFHLKISKSGYRTYETNFTLTQKTSWEIALQEGTTLTESEFPVGVGAGALLMGFVAVIAFSIKKRR